MKNSRNGAVPFPLLLIFSLAVLVPSIALSFLALRAAERESMYVERRLEGTLLAEVDLAARRVEELMNDISLSLGSEAASLSPDRTALRRWKDSNPLVGEPFMLQDTRLLLAEGLSADESFPASFGAFLRGELRLPVYDSVAGVYRKEMQFQSESAPVMDSFSERMAGSGLQKAQTQMKEQESETLMEAQEVQYEPPEAAAPRAARPSPAKTAPSKIKTTVPAAPDRNKKSVGGIERQMATNRIAADPKIREEAFRQASQEGFEILQRNVVPGGQLSAGKADRDERSRTVSRSRTFDELLNESNGGLLPRLSDSGLEILFWTKHPDGTILGCTLRMDAVRERVAEVIPEIFSEVRLLTVLDDSGDPVVVPEKSAASGALPEWRRPFVAREISPSLPRWEVGAWLTDPAILTSRARFAALAVWVLVAVLFLVIAVGSVVVLRMLSAEIRLAGQKTTFVANVSHELKTPLTSIRLFAELLLSGKQGSEERRREYLRTMMSEADRLSHLVDNVLSFSRRGRSNAVMSPLCLTQLTKDTVEQLRPHLTKNGFEIYLTDDGPLPVPGNREALRQVLMNLLSNAEKYSDQVREISVHCGVEHGFAMVKVADRGIGVEPEFAEKIFLEFFRSDDSLAALRSGTGLGLSIARDIARRHGGDVVYAPRPGGGSVFSLKLPLYEDAKGDER